MTKNEIAAQLANGTMGISKAAAGAMLDSLGSIVSDALKRGDEVSLPGLGKLKVSDTPARPGRNPKTGEPIEIAARRKVSFKAGTSLKAAIG